MDQRTLGCYLARAWVTWLFLQSLCSFAQAKPPDVMSERALGTLPEDATQEQSYYLQQLFGQYGENGTLSFEGLTRLLRSLGLGKVQVVKIEHEELGHNHVSHLDILEVQENKHLHSHSTLDHLSKTEQKAHSQAESVTPTRPGHPLPDRAIRTTLPPALHGDSQAAQPPSFAHTPEHAGKEAHAPKLSQEESGLNLLEGVIALDHPVFNHMHGHCLNGSQLLVNFGLNTISKITPEQFTLLCPALLYQIDSRVCIQHLDNVAFDPAESSLWTCLGWGFVAITLTSLPSILAIVLVPLLSQELFQFLLTFLVALAVGTLCGDALLHLWPHAQGSVHGLLSPSDHGILKGLCVLGGIYFLFLIENLMGKLNQIRAKRKKKAGKQPTPPGVDEADALRTPCGPQGAEFQSLTVPEEYPGNRYGEDQDRSIQIRDAEDHRTSLAREEMHHHHGHSHSPSGTLEPEIADIAWMVILGDGVHNFTDGLAIGAAFSDGLSSGLSTALAVFCHELPHELGDCAVLLQAGMSLRWVLLFNLLSAFLAYWGTVMGAIVSQSTAQVTPWIFATTAGVFLYVALVDMLPEMLQRHSNSNRKISFPHLVLQNLGFLSGAGLMLCIALFEESISVRVGW